MEDGLSLYVWAEQCVPSNVACIELLLVLVMGGCKLWKSAGPPRLRMSAAACVVNWEDAFSLFLQVQTTEEGLTYFSPPLEGSADIVPLEISGMESGSYWDEAANMYQRPYHRLFLPMHGPDGRGPRAGEGKSEVDSDAW